MILTPIPNFIELSRDDKKLKRGQGGRQTGYYLAEVI